MKNFFIITVVFFVIFSISLYSQEVCETIPIQGEIIRTTSDNGIYLTSKNNLKVLVVFVSFKDDSSYHPNWPVDNHQMIMQHL